MFKRFLPVLLVCAAPTLQAQAAAASAGILIPEIVPYEADAATEAVRKDCTFDRDLPQRIAAAAAEQGLDVQLSDKNLTKVKGRALLIRTVETRTSGGGPWTGTKYAHIHGELRESGRIIGDFEMKRGTKMNWSGCGSLRSLAKALGNDVVEWLKHPEMGTRKGMPRVK